MTMRLMVGGLIAGVLLAGALAVMDAVTSAGMKFALIIGVSAGGLMLLLAFGMSLATYWLASRGKLPEFRRRMLAASIFTGAAGMACGFTAAAIWLAAGRPWM